MDETLARPAGRGKDAERIEFEALFRESRDDVYSYVATLLRDRGLAEDVTAAAFERAYRKRGSYVARRGTPRAWLFGIARNAALDELRKRPRASMPVEGIAGEDAAEEAAELSLRWTVVRDALGSLAPRERDLIALKFHAGLTNRELARVLGTSESNAGTMLHRTIGKLRKACDDES